MVDFVKIGIHNATEIKQNPLLDFTIKLNRDTAEVEIFEKAHYKGLEFKIWDSGFLMITGSLHKYYNNGEHNHNDFTHYMLKEILNDFEINLGLYLTKCIIQNIEFGVNIKPITETSIILENLFEHKTIQFENGHFGYYRQAKHKQYFVKVYDKAEQYKLSNQLMRFELKFVKMEIPNKHGVFSLNDLLNDDWKESIQELLLKEWNKILMFDSTIRLDELDKRTRDKKILQWCNTNYWKGLNKSKKCRELKKYKSIVKNHSSQLQFATGVIIQSKWNELANL
jgi:thioester reductase-like protein